MVLEAPIPDSGLPGMRIAFTKMGICRIKTVEGAEGNNPLGSSVFRLTRGWILRYTPDGRSSRRGALRRAKKTREAGNLESEGTAGREGSVERKA